MERKKRAANLQMQEKELLVDLVTRNRITIESKATDVASVRTKTEGWKRLAEEFNGITPSAIPREWQQLKHAYENIKCRSKKALANDRVERLRTGGGTFVSQVDPVDEKVATLLGNRARPLINCYDSDAAYCDETVADVVSVHQIQFLSDECDIQAQVGLDQLYGSLCGHGFEDSHMEFTVPVQSAVSAIADPAMSTVTATSQKSCAAISETTSVVTATTPSLSVAVAAVSASSSTVGPSTSASAATARRPWANRRRPQTSKHSSSRDEASSKVAALADSKKAYYAELLAMRRIEHQRKLEVLELKQKYYSAKLHQLEE